MDMTAYALADMDDEAIIAGVGVRMRRVRERAGFSQGHVATRMGPQIDQPRVSKWENGTAQPSLIHLFRYAEICGAEPEELVADIQKPAAQQPPLFRDLDAPATRLVTNLVSLLHERARLLKARETRDKGRRSG